MKLRTYLATSRASWGFTLIELLVVIAIISLLSSIVLASLGQARDKAKDAAIKADLINVRTSAAIYFSDNGDYGPHYEFGDIGADGTICPIDIDATPPTMFHRNGLSAAKSIHDAIKHAGGLTPGSTVLNKIVCFSKGRENPSTIVSYAVIAILNEIGPSGQEETAFCVDSQGAAKTYNSSPGNSINYPSLAGPNGAQYSPQGNNIFYGCP